jgi:hypothetical protein
VSDAAESKANKPWEDIGDRFAERSKISLSIAAGFFSTSLIACTAQPTPAFNAQSPIAKGFFIVSLTTGLASTLFEAYISFLWGKEGVVNALVSLVCCDVISNISHMIRNKVSMDMWPHRGAGHGHMGDDIRSGDSGGSIICLI